MISRPNLLVLAGVPFFGKLVARLAQTNPVLGHITTIRKLVSVRDVVRVELAVFGSALPALVVVSGKDCLPECFADFLFLAHLNP